MWRKLEFASITAVAVTLLFIVIGQSAEQLADNNGLSLAHADKAKPAFNAIDYASTGSTNKTSVVIGPCDTRKP
jgi:galactitol-specific phosphotransferase system IIC component